MIMSAINRPLLELANYHILGRSLYLLLPIHSGRNLTTFGALSAAVEVLNGLGGRLGRESKVLGGVLRASFRGPPESQELSTCSDM